MMPWKRFLYNLSTQVCRKNFNSLAQVVLKVSVTFFSIYRYFAQKVKILSIFFIFFFLRGRAGRGVNEIYNWYNWYFFLKVWLTIKLKLKKVILLKTTLTVYFMLMLHGDCSDTKWYCIVCNIFEAKFWNIAKGNIFHY